MVRIEIADYGLRMAANAIERYNARWPLGMGDLEIEMECMRHGGQWKYGKRIAGNGLSFHYERVRQLLWPHLDEHRWHTLCRDTMLNNKVTVLLGPKSSGKTHEGACFALISYFINPDETTVLVSSTDLRGLELRVLGEIKALYAMAKEQYPWLPGHLVDSKHAIMTDEVSSEEIRDWRNAIIGIPCIVNGRFIGIAKYCGIKNKRVILVGDELQFMGSNFLDSLSNLDGNPVFQAVMMGNPNDPNDALGKAAEPKDGWPSIGIPEKTTVWETRFMQGKCVNLVGTDSPNFDQPGKPKFPYLIHQGSIDSTVAFYGQDSLQYWMMCKGQMRQGLSARRVVTRQMARQFHAGEEMEWDIGETTLIYAVDAAYGATGGDRCVAGAIEFGKALDGTTKIKCYPPKIVPVRVSVERMPEDLIAEWVRRDCESIGVQPENVFFDATGRGSLGTAFARIWSALVNPVEFGGKPSDRPVSLDLYTEDTEYGGRKLKLCTEHYSKRVTEYWFSVRYAIESDQIRELPDEVLDELCAREWKMVRGDKIEIETKADMKERFGRSPDLADWLVTCLEGARQRGFQISKLAGQTDERITPDWLLKLRDEASKLAHAHELAEEAA